VAYSVSRSIVIDIGAYVKENDDAAFSGSTLCHFLEDFESALPKPASFEGSGTEMSFFVLGDKAYPLKMYLVNHFARMICHVKNVFLITGCREQGEELSVPLVS
jgi:hypothetical protein